VHHHTSDELVVLNYNNGMKTSLFNSIPSHVICVAVSKHRSVQEIEALNVLGVADFGENKVQELLSKAKVGQPWKWHFVGHLQTNKVKVLLPWVSLIHSVDSMKLLKVIDQEAKKMDIVVSVLLQLNLTREASKYGMDEETLEEIIKHENDFPNVKIKGLMVMGPSNGDHEATRAIFQQASLISQRIQKNSPHMNVLSMGMSDDYTIAIENNATHIRLGRILFEE